MLGATLSSGSAGLLAEALDDRLHQPYRAKNTPIFAVRAKLPEGALGATLSGSGPTVIVWARDDSVEACAADLSSRFPDVRVLRLSVSPQGAGPA